MAWQRARALGTFPMSNWLGVDYGSKRIGIASGDTQMGLALPVAMVPGGGDEAPLIAELIRLAQDYDAEGMVVGWPLNMDDSEGPQALLTRKFASRLAAAAAACTPPIDVRLWDERLSSFAADQSLAGHLTRGKRRQRQDALAAANILGDFLANEGPTRAARPDDISPA